MRKTTFIMTLVVLALAATGTAFAAAGDSCNEATSVLSGVTFGEMGNGSRWYSFEATRNGDFPVNTSYPGTEFDTRIAVFGACGGAPIAENAGVGQRKAHAVVSAFPGQRFFIEVSRIGGAGSRFELGVDAQTFGPCPGVGDCFVANGSPSCDDTCGGMPCPSCCDLVCAGDPFCCSVGWDALCVQHADGTSIPPGPCVVIPVELKNFEIDG